MAGVFVLGMHRSGTSAATRLISLLGVRVPPEDDLVQASEKNPTGYWESMSLVWFNTRVLTAVGSDERCPSAFEPGWENDSRLENLRGEAPAAVREVFPIAPWVWKDPRNCLTLAFWRSALDIDPVVVLVNRNPLEIDASARRLGRWEGKILTLAIWERYLRLALSQTRGLPVLVTNYRELLVAPVEWSERTGDFLTLSGVSVHEPREGDVLGFVDRGLSHATCTREDFLEDPDTSNEQRELFRLLEEMERPGDYTTPPDLPAETPGTERILAERRRKLGIDGDGGRGATSARRLYTAVRRLSRGRG